MPPLAASAVGERDPDVTIHGFTELLQWLALTTEIPRMSVASRIHLFACII